MTTKKGDLYSDVSGKVWKVEEIGRQNVWARCRGYKRMFGLGTWLEEFEPFGCEEIELMMEV